MSKAKRITAVWLAALLFVTGLTIAPISAQETQSSRSAGTAEDAEVDTVEEVEKALEEVLGQVPSIGDAVEESAANVSDLEINQSADVAVSLETSGGESVEIPEDATAPIVLESSRNEALEIELPGTPEDAEVTSDGTVIYEDAAADTDIVAQAQEDGGVRLITVIDGPEAPSQFTFESNGDAAQADFIEGTQTVLFKNARGKPIAAVPDPWAVDAEGNPVPAWYTLDGVDLTLHVDHSQVAAYPVVADPLVVRDCGWTGCSWYLSVRDTLKFYNDYFTAATAAVYGAGSVAVCSFLYASGIGGAACSLMYIAGAYYGQRAFENAARNGGCVRLKAGLGNPISWVQSSHSKCQY